MKIEIPIERDDYESCWIIEGTKRYDDDVLCMQSVDEFVHVPKSVKHGILVISDHPPKDDEFAFRVWPLYENAPNSNAFYFEWGPDHWQIAQRRVHDTLKRILRAFPKLTASYSGTTYIWGEWNCAEER